MKNKLKKLIDEIVSDYTKFNKKETDVYKTGKYYEALDLIFYSFERKLEGGFEKRTALSYEDAFSEIGLNSLDDNQGEFWCFIISEILVNSEHHIKHTLEYFDFDNWLQMKPRVKEYSGWQVHQAPLHVKAAALCIVLRLYGDDSE